LSYRSLGSDEVTLRNYRPVGRRKGNMSLSDPLAAGVVVDLHKPASSLVFGYGSQAANPVKLDFWSVRNYPGRWVWITQPAGRRSGVLVLR
jgi:hypothetical protein